MSIAVYLQSEELIQKALATLDRVTNRRQIDAKQVKKHACDLKKPGSTFSADMKPPLMRSFPKHSSSKVNILQRLHSKNHQPE